MRNINDNSQNKISQQDKIIFRRELLNCSKEQIQTLNLMVDRNNNFANHIETQDSISKRTKIKRQSICRITTILSTKGLIIKKSRGRAGLMKKACQYILPEIWEDPDIRNEFKHIIPALQIKKRYSSFQSVKNSKYLSWKILQTASSSYINVSPSIISLNNDDVLTNTHISNDTLYVRAKTPSFKLNKKEKNMTDYIKSLKGFNESAKVYLSAYPDSVIKLAVLGMRGRNPTGVPWLYFRKILNRIAQEKNVEPNMEVLHSVSGECVLTLPITSESTISVPSYVKKEEPKKQSFAKPYIPTPPAPAWHLNDEQNLARLEKFCGSPEVEAYVKYYGQKGVDDLAILREKFVENWKRNTKENITRFYNNAISMGFGDVAELAKKNHTFLADIKLQLRSFEPNTFGAHLSEIIKPKQLDMQKIMTLLKQDTPEFKPESITIDESSYDEVLD